MMRRPLSVLVLLCAAAFGAAAQADTPSGENPRKVADEIIREAGRHLGKPYQYGGNGPKSFDCTGFTCYVYQKSGYTLSRNSADQAHDGREVKGGYDKYQKGDLVIFGGRTNKKSPGHVGIFIAADSLGKSFTFIHASNSGVTISRIDEPYYAQRFLGVRRILPDFPAEGKARKARFNVAELLDDRSAASRDSVLNALQDRRFILFPDGTWRTEEASAAEFYTVRSGDTRVKIARKFGISVESLREMNSLSDHAVIRLGDRLRVQ